MRQKIEVRKIKEAEQSELESNLHHSDSFVVRRCQIVLSSSRGETASKIALEVGCSDQGVRNVIKAFNQGGLNCLERQSSRPKRVEPLIKESQLEHLQEILHQSPRIYGKARSQWTLNHLAEVCTEQGLTASKVDEKSSSSSGPLMASSQALDQQS